MTVTMAPRRTTFTPTSDLLSTCKLTSTIYKVRRACFLSHAWPAAWNSLPHELRAAPTLNIFKSKLKSHI